MSTVPARLAAFAVVLVVAFGGAYAAGAAIGPWEDRSNSEPVTSDADDPSDHGEEHGR